MASQAFDLAQLADRPDDLAVRIDGIAPFLLPNLKPIAFAASNGKEHKKGKGKRSKGGAGDGSKVWGGIHAWAQG